MKNILIIGFLCLVNVAKGQSVPLDSLRSHEGALTTVCEKVSDVFVSSKSNIYINFGGKYPNNTLSVVIFAKDTVNFKEYKPADFLKDKKICVTGKVEIYKDKPQIVVKGPNQFRFPDQE